MPSKIKQPLLSLLLLLPASALAQDTQPGGVAVPASLTALANVPADAVNDAANLSFPGMQALQTVWFAQRVSIERAQLDELRAQTARLAELRDQTAKLAAAVDSLATWAKQPATGATTQPATTQPVGDSVALLRVAVALEAIQVSQATQAQRMVMLQGNAGRIEGATTRLAADFAAAFKPVVTTQPATTQPVGGAK